MLDQDLLEWATVRAAAVNKFDGDLPRPDTELEIVEHFERNPRAVLRAIDEVAAGTARSGWAVLRSRLRGMTPVAEATVRLDDGRSTKVERAERWMRNVGLLFDREEEILDELFGDFGPLRAYASDEPLRQRLVGLWRQLRPAGALSEEAFEQLARERLKTRARVEGSRA